MEVIEKTKNIKSKPFFKYDPVSSILLVILVFFASQFLASIMLSAYPAIQSWTEEQSRNWLSNSVFAHFFYIVIAEVLAISMTLRLVRLAKSTYSRVGLIYPRWKDVGWAFIAYGLYFISFLVTIIIVQQFVSGIDLDQKQQIGFDNAYTRGELIMTFFSLVILVPLAEEIMFRGFLLTSLLAKYKYWTSAIITSLIFGIAHLQFGSNAPLLWAAALDTFILSLFLCYFRYTLKSIWPAVMLHAIKNGMAFMILFGPRIFY